MTTSASNLTPLAVAVLSVLREDDMHPYEVIRLMRSRRDDRLVPLTNGSVYHAFTRLEKNGLVAEVGVDRSGNRPERTTYTLTPAGAAAGVEWLRRELPRTDHPAEFRLALAEAHALERDEVISLLTTHREGIIRDLAELTSGVAGAYAGGVHAQFLVELERDIVHLQTDLGWIDGLLARLESHEIAWGTSDITPTHHYLAQREAARS